MSRLHTVNYEELILFINNDQAPMHSYLYDRASTRWYPAAKSANSQPQPPTNATSAIVQYDAHLNADHNTQQTNPAAGQLKATDTLHASTNTASFCTVQTTNPPAQVTTLCSSKLPQSLSIIAYKRVQSLDK